MNGDTVWLWQELIADPETGVPGWGVIGTMSVQVMGGCVIPLMSRDPEVIEAMRVLAEIHVAASGNPLRLARYELAEAVAS
jgi:hypothetical protein